MKGRSTRSRGLKRMILGAILTVRLAGLLVWGGDGATKVWRLRVRHSGLLCFVFRPFLRPSNAYHLVFAISQGKSSPDDAPVRHDLLASLQNTHGDADINSASWCPREGFRNLLATAGDDGTVQIWKIIPS